MAKDIVPRLNSEWVVCASVILKKGSCVGERKAERERGREGERNGERITGSETEMQKACQAALGGQ